MQWKQTRSWRLPNGRKATVSDHGFGLGRYNLTVSDKHRLEGKQWRRITWSRLVEILREEGGF
jgi:hypothetical protein